MISDSALENEELHHDVFTLRSALHFGKANGIEMQWYPLPWLLQQQERGRLVIRLIFVTSSSFLGRDGEEHRREEALLGETR